jgi:alpha/beta superfamily hydrolase
MRESILIPGRRDSRGWLDSAGEADAVVVACPPHPQQGGSPTDERLRAVSDALVAEDVDCLRLDYGPWAEGQGERRDVENAVAWARERYETVGLFGYSFGATLALVVASEGGVDAASALAPDATLGDGLDAVASVSELRVPTQVCVGERDTTVDWEPVADAARERGFRVETLPADHFFVGQAGNVAEVVREFLVAEL